MQTTARSSAVRGVAVAGLASFGVAALGTLTWGPLLVLNLRLTPAIPWSAPAEWLALALIWLWLGGRGWPARWAAARRSLLRSRPVSRAAFAWSALAGALSLAALAGLWIVLVRITGAGGNPTLPDATTTPLVALAALILTGSLVSPLTEEAAFRGYGQVLLERRFPPVAAVALSSLYFSLYHGPTQGFQPSKVLFYLLVGVVFGAIAYLTDSVLPAIPVHIAGDLLFFTLIWPHDAGRALVWTHGADAAFWLSAAQTLVFASLAVLAFRRLRSVGRRVARHPAGEASPQARSGIMDERCA